jgi:hypothetical protein
MSGLLVVINDILINQMKLGGTQDPDWLNDVFGEGRHDRAKSSANDDTSGKADNIAFENELFEFVKPDEV